MSRRHSLPGRIFARVIIWAVLGVIVKLLWNAVMPALSSDFNAIDYWHAVGLLLLIRLLFGSLRERGHGRGRRHSHRDHDRCVPGEEVALKGGMSTSGVVRVDDTVRRPVKENSAFIHDLLRHLERLGFDRAPRFIGTDEKGRDIFSYLSGTVPRKVGGLQKEQWLAGAKLLRQLHDATLDCALRGESEIICHGDPGPGNCVFRDGMPFGFIDFDGAHPGKREEDVGYAAWMWLHIGDSNVAPEQQGSDLVDFVAAYDAAATWNPLEAVLLAQRTTVARLPNSFKWALIKVWAQGCLAWTSRKSERIAAGIARRTNEIAGSLANIRDA